jgi:hypothetical protein
VAEDPAATDPPEDPSASTDPPEGEPSGDDDKEKLRREAAKWRRELRAAQQANDQLRADLERRRVESESEQERAIREAVEAKEQELRTEFAAERLHLRLRERAASKLRDPRDAVLHLGDTVNADADDAAIDKALDELIAERDYLAAPADNGGREAGLVTQGARSERPGGGRESSPDDWIRARAQGR